MTTFKTATHSTSRLLTTNDLLAMPAPLPLDALIQFPDDMGLLEKHAELHKNDPRKPLRGRYAKLRDDLKAANEYAHTNRLPYQDDCDAIDLVGLSITLPRWNVALTLRAIHEAGLYGCTWCDSNGKPEEDRYCISTYWPFFKDDAERDHFFEVMELPLFHKYETDYFDKYEFCFPTHATCPFNPD